MDPTWNFNVFNTFDPNLELPISPFTLYGSTQAQGQPGVELGAQFPGGPYSQYPENRRVHEPPFRLDTLNHLHIPSQGATFQNAPTYHTTMIHTPNVSMQVLAQPASTQILAQNASTEVPMLPAPAIKGRKKTTEYSARELFDILQTGIKVKIFAAKYGQKGAKEKEFGNTVRALGIKGSDGILKARLQDLLVFHEVRLIYSCINTYLTCTGPREGPGRHSRCYYRHQLRDLVWSAA
jgi:hypothetical protein